ncbi:MAG: glutamine amidotransferase [Spirochaetes bacterium]|nr:MAG: glutamine amidotransferase [Spirochaetota bacterium]
MKAGVLALQGDYAAHAKALEVAGAEAFEVRCLSDLSGLDALVLPGGESTVMGLLLQRFGMMEPLRERILSGLPVFGTCAGLILLAKEIEGKDQARLGLLDLRVRRNAYGRQIDSFRTLLSTCVPGAEEIEGVFIRAPCVTAAGRGVEVLASHGGFPVLVRQGWIFAATFHPELVPDAPIHRWFLSSIEAGR